MKLNTIRLLAIVGVVLASAGSAIAQTPLVLSGVPCVSPPFLHCPSEGCDTATVINQGSAVEMKTRRTYFIDYPCDLQKDEKVTLILALHGAGSYGNWQRNYFPLIDYKDKYRLVIATPNSPTHVWDMAGADDGYLQNIVTSVVEQLGKQNIKAFWLVGHSQGGMTSNRIVRTPFFQERVDGWLSLSGGRLGGNPGRATSFGAGRAGAGRAGAAPIPPAAELPTNDFSFIYETGQREMDDKGLPESSAWAAKFSCGPRGKPTEIVDTRAGYVYDPTRQNPPNPSWGLQPAPGKALVTTYPDCKDGRVVADVVRIDKGHTEGLEPHVVEELVKLMVSAKGGKIAQSHQGE
jgi:pimeloyl-ACP methyl ester carboxylesterase